MTKSTNILSSYNIFTGHFLVSDAPREDREHGAYAEYSNQYDASLPSNFALLEHYYNDIYKLFLTKLSAFDRQSVTTEADKAKLTSLFQEILHVKALLEGNK